jgi:hypothetical protein
MLCPRRCVGIAKLDDTIWDLVVDEINVDLLLITTPTDR